MPLRSSTIDGRRRRGGRRGGGSAASSRHRQASVKSFFTKAVSQKPQASSPPSLKALSSQSIPTSAPDSPSIPDEAPEVCFLDKGKQNDAERLTEKIDPPSQDIPEEADEVAQLDDHEVKESAAMELVDLAACEEASVAPEPALRVAHAVAEATSSVGEADAEDAGPNRWQIVSLPSCTDVAPLRELQLVLPFLHASFPPKGKVSMASPVTPGNPRLDTVGKPPQLPCPALSEDDLEQPSRLSRRRNLARRAAVKAQQNASAVDVDGDPIVVDDDEEEETVVRRSRKRSCPKSSPEKEKVLHPFFKATSASIKEAKDRPKRPRIAKTPSDAWTYTGATVHVDYGGPLLPWTAPPDLRLFAEKPELELKPTTSTNSSPIFEYYPSECPDRDTTFLKYLRPAPRKVCEVKSASSETWAEKYKQDRRVDVISAASTKELVDWLIPWYANNKHNDSANTCSSDDESMCSFVCEPEPCDQERIAIVSGPVGCGKSTIVANAARHLGLTILEINSSACRTGKRVRDIIGEALRTHRVGSIKLQKPGASNRKGKARGKRSDPGKSGLGSSNAKTLILFEEVDKLQEDEKGFWPSLLELTASEDCRRPIICTANAFSSQMQQHFIVPKEHVEADFERLLIHSKEEHILNPVPYKHISFPERSERQSTAALKRVMTSEKVSLSDEAIEYLALTYRKDLRKAINLLHFFGLPGLHNRTSSRHSSDSDMPGELFTNREPFQRTRLGAVADLTASDFNSATFHIGSESYERMFLHGSGSTRANDEEERQNWNALESWCTSLNVISDSDTIISSADGETRKRSGEAWESFDELCLDVDLQTSTDIAEELRFYAVGHSRKYLCLDEKTCSFASLMKDIQPMDPASGVSVMPECPNARRPILSEYFPVLRTMAYEASSSSSNPGGCNGEVQERVVRRTRASMKKGGFCALDLNVLTVSELKRTALRSHLSDSCTQ